MTTKRVILFVFAGRKPNLELQIPMVKRILEENPNTEYHVWNFARNDNDREYVKTISGPQITVFNGTSDGFASPIPTAVAGAKQFGAGEHNAAYRHYSQTEFSDCLFMKVDDDIVFLETARFKEFVAAIDAHRGSCMVANIINNGACTPVNPGIWEGFQKLNQPLLDIHIGRKYPEMAHNYFFDHHEEILNQPIELIPTEDWTSINAVGYDWPTLFHVINTIGKPQPAYLSGRPMQGWGRVFGDEGVFQTLPRIIVKGFTAVHLTFGPQSPTAEQMTRWLHNYRAIGQHYLDTTVRDDAVQDLPELSEVSCGYVGVRHGVGMTSGTGDWRTRWLGLPEQACGDVNDPTTGRYKP